MGRGSKTEVNVLYDPPAPRIDPRIAEAKNLRIGRELIEASGIKELDAEKDFSIVSWRQANYDSSIRITSDAAGEKDCRAFISWKTSCGSTVYKVGGRTNGTAVWMPERHSKIAAAEDLAAVYQRYLKRTILEKQFPNS